MAQIAVNTRLLLSGRLGGIGWFAHQALSRMVAQHPEHTFHFLFDRPCDEQFIYGPNVHAHVLGPQARHPILYKLWFDYAIPKVLRKIKADVFLSPDGYLSLRTEVPSLAVIHDLNFEAYPKDLPKVESWYYRRYFPRFAKAAARIATVSHFSKTDLVRRYTVDAEKIDVVYNGVNPSFRPIDADAQTESRRRFAEGKPYFVYVGAQNPRKNLHRLFQAFDAYSASDNPEMRLVIVGEKMYWNREMTAAYDKLQHKERVLFTGRLDSEHLNAVVAGAKAMTFVSYYEGFGIPVLEAFAAGVPLLIGDATALPEIAADAALAVDPFSVAAIEAGMVQLATDETLCQRLVHAGSQRVNDFSWDNTARDLWRSLENILPQT